MIAALRRIVRKYWRHPVISRLPSRTYMQTDLLPAVAAAGCRKMLFVGSQGYNKPFYDACTRAGIEVWSIDYEAAASEFGAPAGHFIGDIREVDRVAEGHVFDVIFYNGVLGFGINTAQGSRRALEAIGRVAAPGAILLVGWNSGRTAGQEISVIRERLKRLELPGVLSEKEFAPKGLQTYAHRYELFRLP